MRRFLGLLVLIAIMLTLWPHVSSAASFTTSASTQPSTVAPGATVTINTAVQSDTSMTMLVDVEMYAPNGQQVFQRFWDNQSFTAGQARNFSATWAVPANMAAGAYAIKVGLFSPGWGSLYHWNNSAGQLTIGAGSPGGGNGNGSGLTGQYYDNQNLTGLKLTRTDRTVDFNWGSGSPASGMGADTFSVSWGGKLLPRYSETYTFHTISDDGVRLWVNGQQIINNWTSHSPTEDTATISLSAGQQYDIRLDYYENGGGARIQLAWSSPSQAWEVIPASQLFPATSPTATPGPITPTATTAPPTPTATQTPAPTAPPATPTLAPGGSQYFRTLPPGSALPSDAQCAAAVKRRPENKGMNASYNATPGDQGLASNFFGGTDPRANSEIAARVTGNFTGTTDEILQWVACKWGVDEDMVRAQAALESWWRQPNKGDWTTDASRCAPGHGLGADGVPGQCPESFGIMQNRYPYEQSAWPGIERSTAFNADTAYAIWRACYEGYEWWLNQVEQDRPYAAGDAWGCMGRWLAGRWYTQPAVDYIGRVQGYHNDRIWEQPSFQEP